MKRSFIACIFFLAAAAARADVAVGYLPFSAYSPNRYYLTSDVSVPAGALGFIVNADNVTFDLNGHAVTCTGGPAAVTRAVSAYARAGVTVRNGVIRNCGFGFEGRALSRARIENVRFIDNYFRAIVVDGSGSEVLNNRIENTTPSAPTVAPAPAPAPTPVPIPTWPGPRTRLEAAGPATGGGRDAGSAQGAASLEIPPTSIGIEIFGERNIVRDNTVIDTSGTAESVGISVSDRGIGGVVANNVLRNGVAAVNEYGIWVGGSSDVQVIGNTMSGFDVGLAASSPTKGLFRNNTVLGAQTSYAINGAWANGGNNF